MNCFAMAALSDTPTPAQISMMPADDLQVSIKVEQGEGVLHDENDEYGSDDNGSVNGRRGSHSIMQCDSNYSPEAQNRGSSYMAYDNMADFPRNVQIKSEPPIDIDDRNGNVDNASALMTPLRPSSAHSPVIRLTPTNKLMPSPNASNPKRRYECPYSNCTKSYGKSSHLRSHLTWHTGIKPFVCQAPGCGKGFTRSDELNRHVRTHTGEKPFECVQCSKKFSRSDHLTKHLATHSKQMAGAVGGISSPLQATPKRQRQNKQSPMKLSPMAMMLGQNPLDQPTTDFSKGEHFMAGFMTKTEPGLAPLPQLVPRPDIEHLPQLVIRPKIEPPQQLVHRPEIKPIQPEQYFPSSSPENLTDEPETKVKIKYETPEEGEVGYNTIADMELRKSETEMYIKPEQQQQDDEDGEEEEEDEPDDDAIMPEANLPPIPLAIIPVASICPTPSSPIPASLPLDRPKKVRKRKTSDNGLRLFPCFECSKKFKRQDDLNRHTRTHTGEKPFHCNECEKRFMRSDHLKKHMNTHTRIR